MPSAGGLRALQNGAALWKIIRKEKKKSRSSFPLRWGSSLQSSFRFSMRAARSCLLRPSRLLSRRKTWVPTVTPGLIPKAWASHHIRGFPATTRELQQGVHAGGIRPPVVFDQQPARSPNECFWLVGERSLWNGTYASTLLRPVAAAGRPSRIGEALSNRAGVTRLTRSSVHWAESHVPPGSFPGGAAIQRNKGGPRGRAHQSRPRINGARCRAVGKRGRRRTFGSPQRPTACCKPPESWLGVLNGISTAS